MKYFLIALTFLSLNLKAEEKPLKIFWDCYFPGDWPANCQSLYTNYEQLVDIEKVEKKEQAEVVITLRQQSAGNFTNVSFRMDGSGKLPKFIKHESLINELAANEAFQRIENTLIAVTLPFLSVKSVDAENGDMKVTFKANGGTADDSKTSTGNYFIRPSFDGSFSTGQGVNQFSINPEISAVKVDNKTKQNKAWGWVGYFQANSNTQSTPFVPGNNTGRIWKYGGGGFAHSFQEKGHWSVALFTRVRHVESQFSYENKSLNSNLNPLALKNQAIFWEGKAGVEWILVPFQEDDSGNVAIRYAIGPELHEYIDPESFEQMKQMFVQHSLSLQLSKHFKKIDIASNLRAYSNTVDYSYAGTGLDLRVAYRVTPRISWNTSLGISYQTNWIPSPASSNATFQTLSSGNRDAFMMWGRTGISINIGNTRLSTQDRRWNE
ncbi:MAG: hypothetical protein JNM93_04740 [Bacteriovoracaceae bacterium]|nr:hypothetical protein [Bacteriovoracaceae bacterium]